MLVTDAGYFLLTTDETGRPVVREFARVVTLGKPTTPPTQPPTQPPLTQDLTAKARAWVAQVPESKAKPLVQGAIRSCLEIIGHGKASFKSVAEAEQLLGQLLKASIPETAKADWLSFGKSLQDELDSRKVGATLAQYCEVLNAIAKGLQ